MSVSYLVGLAAAVFALLVLRALPAVRSRSRSRPMAWAEVLVLVAGVLGLVFHCGAMFFASTVLRVPGSTAAVEQVNAMGPASKVWFAVPAILVLLGLHRQFRPALAAVALTLTAVGITMYDDGPLDTHLTAIFAAALTLTATLSLTVSRPALVRS